jgi:hypothetical protein
MNNPMNRKLFKPRTARNKLNQMGGIMASDAELMQTVARYNMGGPVQTFRDGGQPLLGGNLPQRPATTFSGTPQQFRMLPRAVQQQVLDAENTQRGIAGSLATAGKFASIPIELGYGTVTGAYDLAKRGLQGVGLADPSVETETRPLGLFGMFDEMREKGAPIQNVEELQGILAMQQGEVDPAIQRAMEQDAAAKEQEAVSAQLGQDVFGEGYGMSPEEKPFMMPGVTPSQMPEEKPVITPEAAPKVTTGDGAARDKGRAGTAAADPQIIAAKKGELGPKAQVEAVINAGTQEEQQDQLKTLMAEFTQNAPQYEGMNRGLAIAKIGFAMAAGKSPNAISNIASALEQGADMFIKDKEKRDSFNRQVQLSALQYGLGEQSKDRAAKRAMQYQTAEYVLMPGESYTYPDGRTVTAKADGDGMTISLNKAEVLEKGLPDGVQGTNLATAILQKKATYETAAIKARKDAVDKITVNDPKKITDFVDNYSKAANSAIQANNAMHLTRQVMVMNADGDVTGFRPGFNSALAKAMALAGVDATSYTDRDLAIADLRKVFQKLVPLTLGKDQSANSISNKDVDRLADAYMSAGILDGGITALMTTPANVLNSKLSGILNEFQNAEDQALEKLTSLEQTGNEFITPSGTNLGARVGEQRSRVQEVFPQKGVRPMLAVGDDGVFRLATGG